MGTEVLTLKIIECLKESAVALDPRIIERLAHIRKDVMYRYRERQRSSGHAVLRKASVLRGFMMR